MIVATGGLRAMSLSLLKSTQMGLAYEIQNGGSDEVRSAYADVCQELHRREDEIQLATLAIAEGERRKAAEAEQAKVAALAAKRAELEQAEADCEALQWALYSTCVSMRPDVARLLSLRRTVYSKRVGLGLGAQHRRIAEIPEWVAWALGMHLPTRLRQNFEDEARRMGQALASTFVDPEDDETEPTE